MTDEYRDYIRASVNKATDEQLEKLFFACASFMSWDEDAKERITSAICSIIG